MKCPKCNNIFIPNGCGGVDDWKTVIITKLPSSKKFKPACSIHDWDYHYGSTKETRKEQEKDRKIADINFLINMKDIALKEKHWWKRLLYCLHAYRNYYLVRKYGEQHFTWNGCIQNKKDE